MPERLAEIILKGADWKRLENKLGVSSQQKIERLVSRALKRAGYEYRAEVRRRIKKAEYEENSSLTTLLKGSSLPLVNHGDLLQSISVSQERWNEVVVGVLRTHEKANVAAILHSGATIRVTKKMRTYFATILKVTPPKVGRVLRIPARPFLTKPLEDSGVKSAIMDVIDSALKRSLEK